MFSDKTYEAFRQALEANRQALSIFGYPGRADGGNAYTFEVLGQPGFIYVRIGTDDELTLSTAANPNRVALNPQLLVRMEREDGKLVIKDANLTSALYLYGGSLSDAYSAGERAVTEDRFLPGLIEPSPDFPNSLTILIHSFIYNDTVFPDTHQALDAYLPATTDFFCWVKVGVQESDGTVWLSAGDEFAHATRATALLTLSKIGEIDDVAGVIVLGAVLLQEAQTALARTDCVSWRQFFVAASNSGGGINVTVRVVTAAGAVTLTTADYVVVVNKTVGAATTVNLPTAPTMGDIYVIKDGKGDAATNNLTLTPAAGTIDGAGTYVMNNNYQSISLAYNGTQWNIV